MSLFRPRWKDIDFRLMEAQYYYLYYGVDDGIDCMTAVIRDFLKERDEHGETQEAPNQGVEAVTEHSEYIERAYND